MASKTGTEKANSPSTAVKTKKKSKSIIGALLVAVFAVAMFYTGAQYYTAKRSVTLTGIACGLAEDGVTLYRLPSGALDKFAPDDPYSATVKVPMAPTFTVKDAKGKTVKPAAFYVAEGSERAVKVTVNPQGKVCRVQDLDGFFSVRGSAFVKDKRELIVNGKSYFVAGTLFMSSGSTTGKSGDELEGSVETGDTVKMLGFGDQPLVVDVSLRAGRLSVTSNVESSRVYVDGTLRGKTPLVVSCAPGARDILVRADGYKDDKASVSVTSMGQATYAASLKQVTGTLNLSTTPSGATVYVGNETKGKTPAKVEMPPGCHQVRFEMEGYYPKTVEAIVAAEQEQPVSVALVRMAGSSGGSSGGGAAEPSREVTVVSSRPSAMTFDGMYPAGYVDTFKLTGSTSVDGWPASQATLEKLLPGEEVKLTISPDGSVAALSKTYSHGFTLRENVQARSGSSLYLGARWVECSLAWNAIVQDKAGQRLARGISPGDTVTVYGASPKDIRFVRVEAALGETQQTEGHLVATPQGLRVFGDNSIIGMDIPQGLQVADPEAKATVPVGEVPSGSRVRFYVSASKGTVWAEIVWKANVSVSGAVSSVYGASMKVAPQCEELRIDMGTVVFEGSYRRDVTNLAIGDIVLAAGPSAGDIRFIWVKDKALYSRVLNAVVSTVPNRQEKAFYEITASGLGKYPIYAGAQTTFGYPAAKKTLRASELQLGDRVKLWVDNQRQIVWGEVVDKTDTKASGVYLGVKDGFTYLSGFQKFDVRNDLIITGISSSDTPQPGTRVQVAGTGSVLSYMEVLTDVKPKRHFKGKVLASGKGLLRVKGNWLYEEIPYAKDAWFVDWELMRDGPVTDLFPGDVVDVSVNIADEAMFVERTYSPPFKFEGTVKASQDRTLVITDKTSAKTVKLDSSVQIHRNGSVVGVSDLVAGDKVKVSGESKDRVDLVVSGW